MDDSFQTAELLVPIPTVAWGSKPTFSGFRYINPTCTSTSSSWRPRRHLKHAHSRHKTTLETSLDVAVLGRLPPAENAVVLPFFYRTSATEHRPDTSQATPTILCELSAIWPPLRSSYYLPVVLEGLCAPISLRVWPPRKTINNLSFF